MLISKYQSKFIEIWVSHGGVMLVFWDVTPCGLVCDQQHSGGTYFLHRRSEYCPHPKLHASEYDKNIPAFKTYKSSFITDMYGCIFHSLTLNHARSLRIFNVKHFLGMGVLLSHLYQLSLWSADPSLRLCVTSQALALA
jgi:hypothetical protein